MCFLNRYIRKDSLTYIVAHTFLYIKHKHKRHAKKKPFLIARRRTWGCGGVGFPSRSCLSPLCELSGAASGCRPVLSSRLPLPAGAAAPAPPPSRRRGRLAPRPSFPPTAPPRRAGAPGPGSCGLTDPVALVALWAMESTWAEVTLGGWGWLCGPGPGPGLCVCPREGCLLGSGEY